MAEPLLASHQRVAGQGWLIELEGKSVILTDFPMGAIFPPSIGGVPKRRAISAGIFNLSRDRRAE